MAVIVQIRWRLLEEKVQAEITEEKKAKVLLTRNPTISSVGGSVISLLTRDLHPSKTANIRGQSCHEVSETVWS